MSQHAAQAGGLVYTYRKYDPLRFPPPAGEAPDLVSPAFEHLLTFGSARRLTPEQLADAVEIDPSQITGLGPSIDALRRLLEERKRQILETYETGTVQRTAARALRDAIERARPPERLRGAFERAVRAEQSLDFEKLWYRVDQRSDFARQLLHLRERLDERDEIDELATKYRFTGRTALDVPAALSVKEELETIDRLLAQLDEAARSAKVALIDLDALARFADAGQVEELAALRRRVEDLLRRLAEEQGLLNQQGELRLSPKAYRLFQGKLLDQIFSQLSAARPGRHDTSLSGDGAVELQRTKPYEFGDSLANMDTCASILNAMLRERLAAATSRPADASAAPHRLGPARLPIRMRPDDIEILLTRNNPKCATVVLMDMSGSMRWNGLYVPTKRMALALHALICSEYPGDFVDFFEVASLARRVPVGEIVELLPKPVTIYDPVVRLKADMGDPDLNPLLLPPHFTNLQHGLALARQVLQVQDTPNRQIILITDGLPTAHFDERWLYLLYPPHTRTAEATLREGRQCRQQGIIINIFLLSTWSQSEEDVRFGHHLAEDTGGRVFFVTGGELERFVVWDYVRHRRMIIG